jgi:hypothetical protein
MSAVIATDSFLDQITQTVRLIDLFERLLELEAAGFAMEEEPGSDGCGVELVEIRDLQELSERPYNSNTALADEGVLEVLRAFRVASHRRILLRRIATP